MTTITAAPHDVDTAACCPAGAVEQHPAWCAGTGRCGTHLARPADVPATAGTGRVDDVGVAFPRVEVAAAATADGTPAVHVAVFDPTGREPRWAAGLLTTAEARTLIARLTEQIERAEGGA